MKTLIVYDSMYGNTEKIARAMAEAIKAPARKAGDVKADELAEFDVLIVGSPTHGGRPTPKMLEFFNRIASLKGKKVAAFDTRFEEAKQGWALKLLMKTIGFAAPKMASRLQELGGKLVAEPEGFIVTKKEGPLKKGELERASEWAKQLA